MVVKEGSNVTFKCSATGSPTPTITFRREDGEPIKLPGGIEGKLLDLCESLCGCVLVSNVQIRDKKYNGAMYASDKCQIEVCMLCQLNSNI